MADLYWRGGTGNWSDPTHWDLADGGPGPHAAPTTTDNAHFTALSNSTAYIVTIDASATCLDLKFDAAPSVSGTVTLAGSTATLTVLGSLLWLSGMLVTFNNLLLMSSNATGKTITTNGVVMTGPLLFNGIGEWTLQDNWTSNSGVSMTGGSLKTNGKSVFVVYFGCGAINSKSIDITNSIVTVNNSGGAPWSLDVPGDGPVTLIATGSTVNMVGGGTCTVNFGNQVYNNFNITNLTNTYTSTGTATFANLSLAPSASTKTGIFTLGASITVTTLFTVSSSGVTDRLLLSSNTLGTPRTITAADVNLTNVDIQDITAAGTARWTVNPGVETVTNGTFDTDTSGWVAQRDSSISAVGGKLVVTNGATGYGGASRPISLVIGQTYSVSCDYTQIDGSGWLTISELDAVGGTIYAQSAASPPSGVLSCRFIATTTSAYITVSQGWTATVGKQSQFDNISCRIAAGGIGLGDCLGNSGITFTPSATQYWKTTTTGTKSWNTVGNWFLGTNGTGGAGRIPLPQDDVVFDASSIGATNTTITFDMSRICHSINFAGVTNNPTWSLPFSEVSLYGSLNTTGITTTSPYLLSMCTRSSATITTGGGVQSYNLGIKAFGGTVSLQDSLSCYKAEFTTGTFNTNNFNYTGIYFALLKSTLPRTINMGSSLFTLTGEGSNGTAWVTVQQMQH